VRGVLADLKAGRDVAGAPPAKSAAPTSTQSSQDTDIHLRPKKKNQNFLLFIIILL